MQIASTEWFLGVKIQNFENFYNANIASDGKYCCCEFHPCEKNIADLQGRCMTPSCQPYFLVHIRDGSCTDMCSLDKTYQLNNESTKSILDDAVLSVPFKEMEWSDHV